MKVLFIDTAHPFLEKKLTNSGFVCNHFTEKSEAILENIIKEYTGVIIRSKFFFGKKLMDKGVNLKFIGRIGAGMESIDLDYAQKKNIICLNTPEGNRIAVGEHTVGLLLSLMNKICIADSQIRQGIRKREENRGIEIFGKTVSIIGYGNMGSAFAKCLSGFDAKVISYDKYKKTYSDAYVKECELDEIFETTDILSLHVPLTEETHYLVNEAFINKFKKPIFIINTARGKVLNTNALVKGLKNGKILGAALDVIEYENTSFENLDKVEVPEAYNFLLQSDKVVLTPHIAGWTVESKLKMAEVLFEKIKSIIPSN